MFEEKIITKTGYIETTLPFAYYNKLLLNINSYEFSDGVDHLLAGVIETEKKFSIYSIPEEIREIIIRGCHTYNSTFGHNIFLDPPPKYKLEFINTWINFQKKYEYNPAHHHSGDLVFVIWIKIPYKLQDELNHPSSITSNSGAASKFQFTNVSNQFSNISKNLLHVDESFEGKMIIFHSKMEHTVYPFFTSDEYRISMSGNLKIVFED